jgi:hypothetical protein
MLDRIQQIGRCAGKIPTEWRLIDATAKSFLRANRARMRQEAHRSASTSSVKLPRPRVSPRSQGRSGFDHEAVTMHQGVVPGGAMIWSPSPDALPPRSRDGVAAPLAL